VAYHYYQDTQRQNTVIGCKNSQFTTLTTNLFDARNNNMKIDINKANDLLNKSGIARNNVAEANTDKLFKEMSRARFRDDYTASADITDKIDDVVDAAVFEMKELDFCLVDEKEDDNTVITLHVSFRMDWEYDQCMEIDGITTENAIDEWHEAAEQMYEYHGEKDIPTLRKEFEALDATYSTELEACVT
jgi:hypothetical protein